MDNKLTIEQAVKLLQEGRTVQCWRLPKEYDQYLRDFHGAEVTGYGFGDDDQWVIRGNLIV